MEEYVYEIVNKHLLLFLKNKIGLPNYVYSFTGADIIPTLNFKPMITLPQAVQHRSVKN